MERAYEGTHVPAKVCVRSSLQSVPQSVRKQRLPRCILLRLVSDGDLRTVDINLEAQSPGSSMTNIRTIVSRVILWTTLAANCIAYAQRQDGAAAAADAVSDAVQEGHSPYHPSRVPAATGNINSAECQELLAQFNATSPKAYQPATGRPIITSQGRVVPGIERDRARDDLIDTFREKCTH